MRLPGLTMRIHHVAYACADVLDAERAFVALGFTRESDTVDDEGRKVRILFMVNGEGDRIELVSPLAEDSPVSARLEGSRGSSHPYHICYEVNDIEGALPALRSSGYFPASPIAPAPAIGGRNVCFLFSQSGGLMELVEVAEED